MISGLARRNRSREKAPWRRLSDPIAHGLQPQRQDSDPTALFRPRMSPNPNSVLRPFRSAIANCCKETILPA